MNRRRPRLRRDPRRRFGFFGVVFGVVLAVATYVSFNANNGIPLVSTYDVTVEVPNADRMIRTNEVRIGGVRVGQVAKVSAEPPVGDGPPYAKLELALDTDTTSKLPLDTQVKIRLASILGSTYVDLIPGQSTQTVADGGSLPLKQSQSTVDLTDLLDVFDGRTRTSVQSLADSLGTGLAGRGTALGQALTGTSHLLPPLQRVMATLAEPGTRLGGFVDAYDTFIAALDPVRGPLAHGISGAATTFGAIADHRDTFGATIDLLDPAERATTGGLNRLAPAVERLADIVDALRPAAARLRPTLVDVNSTLRSGLPAVRQLPGLASALAGALGELRRATHPQTTSYALGDLRDTLSSAKVTLDALAPMQVQCNAIGLWAPNFASTFGTLGTGEGPAIANIGVTHAGAQGEVLQSAKPAPDVGINYLPHETRKQCESGNEPYNGTQALGNTAATEPNSTYSTQPPAGSLDRARRAGLIGDPLR